MRIKSLKYERIINTKPKIICLDLSFFLENLRRKKIIFNILYNYKCLMKNMIIWKNGL